LLAAATGRAWTQQTGRIYRIAIVRASATMTETSESGELPFYRAIFGDLRGRGYAAGQNLVVERYSSGSRNEHFAGVARDVATSNPVVIFVAGGTLLLALKAATITIPIVEATTDPVGIGVVPSLAKSGGNITGVGLDAGLATWGKAAGTLEGSHPKAVAGWDSSLRDVGGKRGKDHLQGRRCERQR
jgi:ABC transporter substrate binding protein